MLPNTLRTRDVKLAFLFGPPKFVARDKAAMLYGRVCDTLGHDDLTFQYSTAEVEAKRGSRGFSIKLARKEGRGGFRILIDHKGDKEPIRLLLEYGWPPSWQHVEEMFDDSTKAVFESLGEKWQKVFAETRLRAECQVRHHDALMYMRKHLLKLSDATVDSLGTPLSFASVKLHVVSASDTVDPIAGPSRELTVEVLRESPDAVYLELVSKWQPLPSAEGRVDITKLRPFTADPKEYIKDSYDFLCKQIQCFAKEETSTNE